MGSRSQLVFYIWLLLQHKIQLREKVYKLERESGVGKQKDESGKIEQSKKLEKNVYRESKEINWSEKIETKIAMKQYRYKGKRKQRVKTEKEHKEKDWRESK